ncbi:serine/threonine-protein kinase [Streptomyces sp. NPDC006430]|uniref:serine/threonine-protein kinase n=1 Tax=Streptomyces sp. NPDC006430 TaxID=3154299 RepID=UPI0033B60E2F
MRELRATDPVAVGPYRLLAEIGRGGMGRVLLGAGPDGRLVAVKHVHARFAADEEFRARFRREVAASRKVSGAFTAAVTGADPEAETPWLASVFVSGPALGAVVDAAGPLPEESVRRLAAGLATALVEIHRAGLVHRDLKPDNVLLAEDGVRVIDFGIARAAEGVGGDAAELTQSGVVVGSPAFMSPEQAEGKELTPASDVFSLGSVLVLAATGRGPFAAGSTLQTLYDLVHTEPELSAVPAGLRTVVAACLAKDPLARPTPEGILELLGTVTPAADNGSRPWPAAVHAMIAAQQAEVDRVLGAPERTVLDLPPAAAGAVGSAGAPASAATAGAGGHVPTVPTAVATVAAPAGDPQRRRSLRALVVAAAVVVAGLAGVAAYALLPDGGGDDGATQGDKYANMVTCPEAADHLPLPVRELHEKDDRLTEGSDTSSTLCTWQATGEPTHHALVSWTLYRSAEPPAPPNGADLAHAGFAESAKKTDSTPGPGPADEAAWGTAYDDGSGCRLGVRDGNLEVWVVLAGRHHPADTCKTEAMKIARAALGMMPR